ncbi:MAG: M1 family metallopeptidase [Pseudomonadota bacterium]|nr:M1 family metallopeptidase [Pseudomonadota bacterium]
MKLLSTVAIGALAVVVASCGKKEAAETPPAASPAPVVIGDVFTYANYDEVQVTNIDLNLDVDFDSKTLDGVATLDLKRLKAGADKVVLDSNDLEIRKVEAETRGGWTPAEFTLGADDPVMGSKLEIALPAGASKIRIAYRTSPGAEGLQWLSPEQTDGKEHPYLFSQNQSIYARTMAPLQDTPAVRMTYSATLRTPPELTAVMSAEQDSGPRDGEYTFRMPQPVPSYLIAIAVGDIDFKAINGEIGVYTEDAALDAAAREFEDTPLMEEANAALYGPYRWGRYDMLVLPASFPFGGMENPRLTFLTPTLIAGDKSLTNVVAHELAHSWSGNLVTNATWRDAWLNEGFTTYVEGRVMEALYGRERALMEERLALDGLKRTIADLDDPALSQLKLPEDLEHPDDAFSRVAYDKGQFFLRFLEQRFGRESFDPFLKDYFDHFAFRSIVTEDFLAYLNEKLRSQHPDAVSDAEIQEWVYGQGLPSTIDNPVSDAFAKVSAQQTKWLSGEIAAAGIESAEWSTQEWLHFLNTLPEALTLDQFAELDAAFDLSHAGNAEIAFAWYMKTIKAGYEPAMTPLETFLMRVGRGKFIYPLYRRLAENDRKAFADRVYAAARAGYHPIAQRRIDEILQ